MPYRVKLSDLTFFQFATPEITRRVAELCRIRTFPPGEDVLTYGQDVPGLYIVLEGQAEIYSGKYKTRLATLSAGHYFGEMSLIENRASSANIRAIEGEDDVKLLFCDRLRFRDLLTNDFVFAAAFYKGSSEMLSRRLRAMNDKIENEITEVGERLSSIMDSKELFSKLGTTHRAVEHTGEAMFVKLDEQTEILSRLEKELPDKAPELRSVREALEGIMTEESQYFDIISQQIDFVRKHLSNIQRLALEEKEEEVAPDKAIFAKAIGDEESSERGTVEFTIL